MAEKKTAKKPAKGASKGFSDEERAAMKERAKELKAEARRGASRAEGERAVRAAIAKMKGSDREIGSRLHAIITENAPSLIPKTWYGMPAYANADGKVVCFFRDAAKFSERYITFGFQPDANLDEGSFWPTAYALTKLTGAEEKKIAALVKKAVS